MSGSSCYGFEPYAPGLTMRPAARIVQELPPSLAAYRVAVFFRAAPLAAPTVVRSTTAGMKRKKPIRQTPVETQFSFGELGTPFGVGV